MKKIITLFLIACLSGTAFPQGYVPLINENLTWSVGTVGMGYICDFSQNPKTYFFLGDTTFNSVTYKKVYAYNSISVGGNGNNPPYCPPFLVDNEYQLTDIYIREDIAEQRVYRYFPDNTVTEVLLFDFSLEVGDTLNSYIIDSIYTISTPDGVSRRYFELGEYNEAYMIEGIGGNQGPFSEPQVQFEGYHLLMCVKLGQLELFGEWCEELDFTALPGSWAPEGAEWYYTYYSGGWGIYESYMKMSVVGDTVIQNKLCSVLNLVGPGDSIPYYNEYYYTYQEDNNVFLYDGAQFRLLYDFNVQPGDSFESYGPQDIGLCWDDSTTMVVVDSVGFEEVNGINLKYLIVHTPEFNWGFQNCSEWVETYKIYQTIGSLGYMFPARICGADGPAVCALRCYEDSLFGFYTTNVADSCTYEYGVGIEEIDYSDLVKVYPNPVTDHFTIELKESYNNAELSIYSIEGRLIREIELTSDITTIDFSQAEKGCYILRFILEGHSFQGRIVK